MPPPVHALSAQTHNTPPALDCEWLMCGVQQRAEIKVIETHPLSTHHNTKSRAQRSVNSHTQREGEGVTTPVFNTCKPATALMVESRDRLRVSREERAVGASKRKWCKSGVRNQSKVGNTARSCGVEHNQQINRSPQHSTTTAQHSTAEKRQITSILGEG